MEEEKSISIQFHLKEYDALRKEIEMQIIERRKLETQTITAVILVYAWIFTREIDSERVLWQIFSLFPLAVIVIASMKWAGIMLGTIRLGAYIMKIENNFRLNNNLGWEHHVFSARKSNEWRHQLEGWSGICAWLTLFLCSSFVSVVYIKHVNGFLR